VTPTCHCSAAEALFNFRSSHHPSGDGDSAGSGTHQQQMHRALESAAQGESDANNNEFTRRKEQYCLFGSTYQILVVVSGCYLEARHYMSETNKS
jgi:hypothetical protein